MMVELLFHSHTKQQLEAALQRLPHALILSGPVGVGKATVARWFAGQVLGLNERQLQAYAYYLEIAAPDGKAIGIEAVRSLEHFTALKVSSQQPVNRLAVIYDAHLLTVEAQNALLKTLEEPPQGTALILTSAQQQALLPTIRSRAQTIEINRPPLEDLQAALGQQIAPATVKQLLALSGGLPGLAFALAQDDQSHPLVVAATTARQLLPMSSFERLCIVEKLAKNKQASKDVVYILAQMAHAALLNGRASGRWQKVMAAAYEAEAALEQGGQPKLVLTNLMLTL